MNPLVGLSEYLGKLEKNLRMFTLSRGVATIGGAALIFTILLVIAVNWLSFSDPSVFWARVALFLILAFAITAGLVFPLVRLTRRSAARKAEEKFPQFGERLLTFTERSEKNADDPFLPLLALDALDVAKQADATRVVHKGRIASFASLGAAAVMVLVWLGVSGPGFLGYGTSLLWGGLPKEDRKPFYSVKVEPGNKIIRRRSDQVVTARLSGFLSPKVNLMARYGGSTKWEQAPMQSQAAGSSYEFLLAGVPDNVEYYVEAGGVQSNRYKLTVLDLPVVKNVRVTYHFPGWSGMKDEVEDPGGDLRAVEGTVAEVEILTDRPLANGNLTLDDGSKIELQAGAGNKRSARVPIQKDGMYHVASLEQGEQVRMSEDYFIEARKDSPPLISLLRPAKDAKVNPIEEVTVSLKGSDDFGLQALDLHYSVNGSPEKTVSLLKSKGAKAGEGSTTLALEDYKLVPGDIVSLYATARDARNTAKTDIFFIEAQPFEKEYSQSQQCGGGGGEGEGEDQKGISARQKEIIAATWNQLKDTSKNKTSAAENAKYLSEVQTKLRDQAQSLADRMKKRQLAGSNPAFQAFVKDMEEAVAQMGPASDKLKGLKWQDAMMPEQKALQYLLRAESTFRQIQVAFGKQSGGGGGNGGAGRDLENLFDLELDTEKNQYESGQQSAAEKRQKEVDDALKKLEELAKRQQQLAEQNKNQQQTSQQRWQQEMLRREAEQLRREMEQLTRDGSQQQQQGQQSSQQQNQQGQQGKGGQSQSGQQQNSQQRQQQQQQQQGQGQGQMQQSQSQQAQAQQQQQNQQRQTQRMSREQQQQMQEALNRLSQATREMSGAASAQGSSQPGAQGKAQADAERAAERLKEAREMLAGMRKQQAGDEIDEIAQKAVKLAQQQQDFSERLRKNFAGEGQGQQGSQQTAEKMAQEKQQMSADVQRLEQEMQRAARDLANTQGQASAKLREALATMQQNELQTRMKLVEAYLRRGLGSYAVMREAPITQGLNQLKEQIRDAQAALDHGAQAGQKGQQGLEQALAQAEKLRQQIEQMARNGQRGKRGDGQKNGQQPGQQQGQGQQPGQQPGQQGQQSGQQQGQQPGQQPGQQGQQGGQQQGGQQPGGEQPGQQAGQQQGGGGSPSAGPATGSSNGGYRGDRQLDGGLAGGGRIDPQTAYRDSLRDLGRLQQAVQGNQDVARELQDLSRQMQRLDPRKYPNNQELLDQIHSRILAQIEQVELMLRRKLDDQSGTVRSGAQQAPPAGYADAVAEYFRRLSKER